MRSEFGHRSTPAWTVDIVPELPEQLPTRWRQEESLRGDFLRASQALAEHCSPPVGAAADASTVAIVVDPATLLSPDDLPQAVAEQIGWPAVSLDQAEVRRRVLREAAWLGADLLGPNEFGPQEADR